MIRQKIACFLIGAWLSGWLFFYVGRVIQTDIERASAAAAGAGHYDPANGKFKWGAP